MPKPDGRGVYRRPLTGLAAFLLRMKRGQSFKADAALYKRVRQIVLKHKIRLIVRKIDEDVVRIWRFRR